MPYVVEMEPASDGWCLWNSLSALTGMSLQFLLHALQQAYLTGEWEHHLEGCELGDGMTRAALMNSLESIEDNQPPIPRESWGAMVDIKSTAQICISTVSHFKADTYRLELVGTPGSAQVSCSLQVGQHFPVVAALYPIPWETADFDQKPAAKFIARLKNILRTQEGYV